MSPPSPATDAPVAEPQLIPADVGDTQEIQAQQEIERLQKKEHRVFWKGIFLGFCAAIFYTLTNIYLRSLATSGDWVYPILVTFHKTIPVTVIGWLIVLKYEMRGEVGLPPLKLIPTLIATGCLMQFGGNMLFQFALGYCGLALTVPIIFAFIIVTGATFGRIILGERVSIRSQISICILILSIVILSVGVWEASHAVVKGTPPTTLEITWGILAACFSGMSYGLGGVMIRKTVRDLPIASTLVFITTPGTIGFFLILLFSIGWEGLVNLAWDERQVMLIAGVFNAIGFFAITRSLRTLSVVQSNLVNATQIGMAAVAGFLFFSEPLTVWLQLGLVFTAIGLIMMDRTKKA